jgi:phosphoribosylanthranilate isomerase
VPRTRIKICGIMRPEDALAAAKHGADAVGLVFYEQAKRFIPIDSAREILTVLPPFITPVGLFVDESPQKILDCAAELNIRHIQLQGEESPDEIAELGGLKIIKAIKVDRQTISAELAKWGSMIAKLKLTNLAGIVLETSGTGLHGGSGVANDWAYIGRLQSSGEFKGLPPVIAAGGLTPENVGQVVRDLRPFAVDVSSGVEAAFGEKSEEKIEAFMEAVAAAES